VVVDKKSRQIICTAFSNGKQHDFRLFKESKTHIHPAINVLTDSGYQGLQKMHFKAYMPKKRSKMHPLTKEDKQNNQALSSYRVLNENVIGNLKRFKILSDRYRNRRRRFSLRFNLIAGIYNLELIP
jgi:DDE superfamily endonuclease